jgi:hypothetical protein
VSIRGALLGLDHLWHTSGTSPLLNATFNLNITRVHGWYGQKDYETPDRLDPVIQWNTWAHDSLAVGEISFGGQVVAVDQRQYRMYCDMNWGASFPAPPPNDDNDSSYHWGWYSVLNFDPSSAAAPAEADLAIIAGAGKSWSGKVFGAMKGHFGDFQFGSGLSVQATTVILEAQSSHPVAGDWSSDGKVVAFSTAQSDWVIYQDSLGSAKIPLTQTLTVETEATRVNVVFRSVVGNYIRLLFPFKDYLFSDFEALGVAGEVLVEMKKAGQWTVIKNETFSNGGLEFGYKVPIKNSGDLLL